MFFVLTAAAAPDFAALAEASFRIHHQGRSADPIQVSTSVVRWGGGARVRVRPQLDGLPIDGASQVVAFDEAGRELRLTGPELHLERPVYGSLTEAEAVAIANARFTGTPLWTPRAEPVFKLVDGRPRHAWAVDLGRSESLATYRVWVDTRTHEVLGIDRTSFQADGLVYRPSPIFGEPERVTLQHLATLDALSGRYSDAYSCVDWTIPDTLFGANVCNELGRRAVLQGEDFLYEPQPGVPEDPFTEVNLYHHVSVIGAYAEQRFGLRRNRPFTTIANFEMQNAFFGDFDGDGWADLAFGFSDDTQFGYDADVVYHEFGHWIVHRLADIPQLAADDIGLDWTGGSINEGAADVFAMLLEPDPDLGEYAGQGFREGPIRQLEADRTCPGDLEGEVHVDGEILGSLGWNLIQRLGTDVTGQLLVGAVAEWGPDISWPLVSASFEHAASDLHAAGGLSDGDLRFVLDAVAATGMQGCPRVIPLDAGNEQAAFVLSGGFQGDLYRMPGQNQYSIQVPSDAQALVIEVSDFQGPDGLEWSLLVRAGQAIEMEASNLTAIGLGFSTPRAFDWVADGDQPFERVVLDAASDPPLQPGQTYFISVAGRSAAGAELFDFTRGRLAVSARVVQPPEPVGACRTGPGRPWMQTLWRRR